MNTKIIPKILILIFLFPVFLNFLHAQPQRDTLTPFWNLLPIPSPSTIRVITIDSNNTIYIGIWGEGIYRSFTNGQTWTQLNQGLSNKFITAIERDSLGRLFASAYGGGVYLSTNNGQSWSSINSGLPSLKVKTLKIKNPSTVFIGIEGYGVYASTNLGSSWQPLSKGLWNLDINCLAIADDGSILAGTNGDGIYYSNDDGKSWRRSGFAPTFRVITSFVKTGIGEIFCGTYQGGVYSSVDNGISWSIFKAKDTLKNVTAVTFANNAEPVVGTDRIGIWRFDSRAYLDWVMTDFRYGGIIAMARNSRGILFAASSDGSLLSSNDNGSTWATIRNGNNFIKAFFSFNNVLFLSRKDALTFRSTDMGLTWNEINLTNIQINSFAADSSGRIFALANRTDTNLSLLLFSTNYGVSWDTLLSKSDTVFRSIATKNNNIFLGIMFPPSNPKDPNSPFTDLIRSTDGGTTWTALNIRARNTNGIAFIGINKNGTIFVSLTDSLIKSTNNGNSWVRALGISMYNYHSIAFGSNSTIFIAGDYAILSSSDNGTTWNTKPIGLFYQYMRAICITNYDQIIAGSTYGGLLSSLDFGLEWDSTHIYYGFIREPISSIQADESGFIWIITPTNIYRAIDPNAINQVPLLSPTNNSFGQPLKTNFRWNAVSNADLYEFQISDDYEFNIIRESIILGSTNWINYYALNYNTMYFWRVRGKVNNALGKWSIRTNFTTIIAPPELVSPLNNEGAVPIKPTFVWKASDGASGYVLQVSKSPNFNTLVYEKAFNNANDTTSTSQVVLDFYQTYYWRVAAKTGSIQSEWSEVWKFTTKIQPPTLLSPINHTYGVPTIAILKWKPSPGGNIFEIQISLDSAFENKFFDGISQQNDQYQTKILEPFTKYYWRVRASNEDGTSDWSDVWWFITLIPAPELVTPADNSNNLHTPIHFIWNAYPETEKHHIQISPNSNFSYLIVNDSSLVENKFTLENIDFNQTYYWRVRSKIKEYNSNWSNSFQFKTTLKKPTLLYPPNNSDSIQTYVTFQWESIPGASSYDFILSLDSSFGQNIIVSRTQILDNQTDVSGLSFNTKYYWRVRATNSNSISQWSETWSFSTITEPLSIVNDNPYIFVYPNPLEQKAIIKNLKHFQILSIKLFDLNGNVLYDLISNGLDDMVIDLSNKPRGVYTLSISTTMEIINIKLIKK
ncbi:MAG: T9SS type A sorting domain-containing protein [Candidatus Kapaibacteriales bacterium]